MDKPKWWLTKKNEPAADYDEDYDALYYGKKDPDEEKVNVEKTGSLYNEYEDSDISEVRVGVAEDAAREVAKAEPEPLKKKTFTPESCVDSRDVVDAYKEGRVIVIYVEELDRENFTRFFDYIMGAVQALDGELRRIDRETVVLLPALYDEDVSIDELDEEIIEEVEEEEESAELD
jgi:cell division inhibitor SepF